MLSLTCSFKMFIWVQFPVLANIQYIMYISIYNVKCIKILKNSTQFSGELIIGEVAIELDLFYKFKCELFPLFTSESEWQISKN